MFSKESDNFWFDTRQEDLDSELDTSSVLHESELYEEVSDFSQPFVSYGMACQRFSFLSVREMNVDFDKEISVVECLQKFNDEETWQLFAEQTNIYANQFLAANPNLQPQARSWMDTNPTEMKALIGLLILQSIVQKPENGMYFFQKEKYLDTILLTVNDREKIPSPSKIPSLC
jgi:hypothetical protein